MKTILAAIALTIAVPAFAQNTSNATDPHAGHDMSKHGEADHQGHDCCKDKDADGSMKDCCEKATKDGAKMACCEKHAKDGHAGHDTKH